MFMSLQVLFCFVSFPKQDFLEIKYLNEDVNMYILSGDFALGRFFRTIKETAFWKCEVCESKVLAVC